MKIAAILAVLVVTAAAQGLTVQEQQSLTQAIVDSQSSPVDAIRAFEAHLKKYPMSTQRADIEQALAKAALETNDVDRLIRYGEPMLKRLPDDVMLLDRVAFALIAKEDKAGADRAYKYARSLEDLLSRTHIDSGRDAARKQEDLDRAMARALLYQSRARSITTEYEEAARLASRAFTTYPTEEAAREWADALYRSGNTQEAVLRMADAFVVADGRTTEQARMADRKLMGEWYRKLHGSEAGLGDIILAAYDRVTAFTETRRKKLAAMDPNSAAQSAMDYTLTGLDGTQLQLSSLKGKVVVMDFWATWCIPCRVQHPLYETLKQRFPKSSGVIFLEVNADEEHAVVEPFLDEQKWDKEVYFEDGLARMLNVTNIPATILFDKSGNLASRMDGFDPDGFLEQMTQRIQSLLSAK